MEVVLWARADDLNDPNDESSDEREALALRVLNSAWSSGDLERELRQVASETLDGPWEVKVLSIRQGTIEVVLLLLTLAVVSVSAVADADRALANIGRFLRAAAAILRRYLPSTGWTVTAYVRSSPSVSPPGGPPIRDALTTIYLVVSNLLFIALLAWLVLNKV